MSLIPDLVIYHGGCPDGIASAVICQERYSLNTNNFIAAYHNNQAELPDCTNKVVYLLDFCFPKQQMMNIINSAKKIIILDHHKTSLWLKEEEFTNCYTNIDMKYSGAQLTWFYCFPSDSPPWYVNDIADRDLWRFAISGSKEVCSAMFALGYYQNMCSFAEQIKLRSRDELFKLGQVLIKQTDDFVSKCATRAIDCYLTVNDIQYKVRLIAKPYNHHSDLGNKLVSDRKCHFAVMYQYGIMENEWWFSVRAHPDSSIDITNIIKHLDKKAGGHPKAAGFTLSASDFPELRKLFIPSSERFYKSDVII